MQALQFHHIGLVVADLAKGREYCQQVLGITTFTDPVHDPIQRVWVQFCEQVADTGLAVRYELIAPASDDSPIQQALTKRQNILNHLAYEVDDLTQAAASLRELRHMPITQASPAAAFDGALIQFFLSPLGHLLELIERKPDAGTEESFDVA